MIYLCSVYSYQPEGVGQQDMEALMQKRYEYARKRTAEFLADGECVFSPINHCHPVAQHHTLPRTWGFWEKIDTQYIDGCSKLYVLKMPHWEFSTGIQSEIVYAKSKGIPVVFLDCPDYEE